MNYCGTCKHWGKPGDSLIFRQCKRIAFDKHSESDDRDELESDPDIEPNDPESVFDELAVTVDGSGYFAALRTRISFGCVLYEERTS